MNKIKKLTHPPRTIAETILWSIKLIVLIFFKASLPPIVQFINGPVQADLSLSITQSITVSVSDPNLDGLITLINVTASGISSYNIIPANPSVGSQSSTFSIDYTPTRGDYPAFK